MQKWLFTPTLSTSGKLKNILFGFLFMLVWTYLFMKHVGHFYFPDDIFSEFNKPEVFAYFICGCVLAPLWEEVAFRWIPITLFKGKKELLPVIVAVSIFFGYLHGGPCNVFVQGVAGLTLSTVYIKNDYSLKSSMLLHGIWNTFCLIMTVLTSASVVHHI